jgi:hypothetical protein
MTSTSPETLTCAWCDTVNESHRCFCLLCEIELGIPALDNLRPRELDDAIQASYTHGGSRLVAERLVDGRLPWRRRTIERLCIQVAQAEIYANMEILLNRNHDDKDHYIFLGWRWPDSTIVSGAKLWFRRDERIFNERIETRRPGQRAVNFSLPSSRQMENVEVWFRLFSKVGGERISMKPRQIHSINNTQSKARE